MAETYTLTKAAVAIIQRDHEMLKQKFRNLEHLAGAFSKTGSEDVIFGKASSTIPARSGSTAGSGNVTQWKLSRTGGLSAMSKVIKGYNIASSSVTADRFLVLQRDRKSGRYFIIYEDCG